MARIPDLSRFELQCLGRLWSLGQASIREVHAALEDPPSYSTVKKIFERLEEKGAVERSRASTPHVFAPTLAREDLIGQRLQSVADQLCEGSLTPLLTHLVQDPRLSDDERRQLRELVEKLAAQEG